MVETFGERLARLRLERKLSIAELARTVRLSEGAIRNLEKGTSRGPLLFVGIRLARALQVSASYLAFGEDRDPDESESRSLAAVVAAQEHQALEIAGLNRRVSTLEAQGGGDPPRTARE